MGAENGQGHRERLRKRFGESGLRAFSDHEKLELLLTFVIPRVDCKQAAKDLLKKFRTVAGVFSASKEDIQAVSGLGKNTALFLSLAREIFAFVSQEGLMQRKKIKASLDIVDHYRDILRGLSKEVLHAVFLDTGNCLIAEEKIFEGTIDRMGFYTREIIGKALSLSAKSIIIVHNHPGNTARPSREDIEATRKLRAACEVMDMALLDHIIVTRDGHFSFAEGGLMENR